MSDSPRRAADVFRLSDTDTEPLFPWSAEQSPGRVDVSKSTKEALESERFSSLFSCPRGGAVRCVEVRPASSYSRVLSLAPQEDYTDLFFRKLEDENVMLPPPGQQSPLTELRDETDLLYDWCERHHHDLTKACSQILDGAVVEPHIEERILPGGLDLAILRFQPESEYIDQIWGSMAFRTEQVLSDAVFDALDRFYDEGGRLRVYRSGGDLRMFLSQDIGPSNGLHNLSENLRRGIYEVIDSAFVAAAFYNEYQLRTNGNRHIAAGWDEATGTFVFSKSFGRTSDGTPVPGDSLTGLTLAGEFLKLAFMHD